MLCAALIGDLGHHNAGRGIDQQQAVVDDRVSVRPYGRYRGDDRLRHRRQRVSIADPGADGGIGGRGGTAVATNASAKHVGRTYDVMATSSADWAKRWLTLHAAATFLLRAIDRLPPKLRSA